MGKDLVSLCDRNSIFECFNFKKKKNSNNFQYRTNNINQQLNLPNQSNFNIETNQTLNEPNKWMGTYKVWDNFWHWIYSNYYIILTFGSKFQTLDLFYVWFKKEKTIEPLNQNKKIAKNLNLRVFMAAVFRLQIKIRATMGPNYYYLHKIAQLLSTFETQLRIISWV